MVFIASRGTADAYDKRVDFDYALVPPLLGEDHVRMHQGFLREALKHVDLIANCLTLDPNNKMPAIYTTGHSLGVALSAIMYALYFRGKNSLAIRDFGTGVFQWNWSPRWHLSDSFCVNASYTYGMPHYGNKDAVFQLPNPYSIIRPLDLITYLPLPAQGYCDGLREYGTDLKPNVRRGTGPKKPLFRSIRNALSFSKKMMSEHACDLYRNEIANTLGIPFCTELLSSDLRSKGST